MTQGRIVLNRMYKMKRIIPFALMVFLCLSSCFAKGNMQAENDKKTKEEILLLNDSKDTHKAIQVYFEQKNLKYEYWEKGKIESSRIGGLINDDESVYFAIYQEEKKGYIITHNIVYIIIGSNDKIKDIIFDTIFTGP
jgi:hypothetical protein